MKRGAWKVIVRKVLGLPLSVNGDRYLENFFYKSILGLPFSLKGENEVWKFIQEKSCLGSPLPKMERLNAFFTQIMRY